MIALFVKHETPLPFCTQQVHTSVTQSGVIHPEEIRSVLKINLHGAKLQIIPLISTKNGEICENNDAFCETYISLSRCNFAP
jgi:hypothetical protein